MIEVIFYIYLMSWIFIWFEFSRIQELSINMKINERLSGKKASDIDTDEEAIDWLKDNGLSIPYVVVLVIVVAINAPFILLLKTYLRK